MPKPYACPPCARTRVLRGRQNRPMCVASLVAAFLALFLAAPLSAQDARQRAPSDYRQTDAVLTHYPALGHVKLASPAFAKSEPALTSQDEMAAFLATLARNSRHVRVQSLGRSTQGRDIPLVYVTQEGLDDPSSI